MNDYVTFTQSDLYINDGAGWIPLEYVSATLGYEPIPGSEFRISREHLTDYSFTCDLVRPARNRVQNILYRLYRRSEGRDKRYARRMRRHQKRAWRHWQEEMRQAEFHPQI